MGYNSAKNNANTEGGDEYMMLETVNVIAIIGAAVVSVIVGSLWYGPVFGKQWIAEMG